MIWRKLFLNVQTEDNKRGAMGTGGEKRSRDEEKFLLVTTGGKSEDQVVPEKGKIRNSLNQSGTWEKELGVRGGFHRRLRRASKRGAQP